MILYNNSVNLWSDILQNHNAVGFNVDLALDNISGLCTFHRLVECIRGGFA